MNRAPLARICFACAAALSADVSGGRVLVLAKGASPPVRIRGEHANKCTTLG